MSKLPDTNLDPFTTLKAAMDRWGRRIENVCQLHFQLVGIEHTRNLMEKLGNSAVFGYEGINSWSLKIVIEEIVNNNNNNNNKKYIFHAKHILLVLLKTPKNYPVEPFMSIRCLV